MRFFSFFVFNLLLFFNFIFVPISSNKISDEAINHNQNSRSIHTPSVGPMIFNSEFNYTPGVSNASLEYGLIIGRGESNSSANTLVNVGISTSPVTPENNVKWAELDSIISTTYSTSGSWTTNAAPTFDDPEGNGSTDIYEGTLSLKNLPSSINIEDYYLIAQAHGAGGAQYTTYDVKPLNFSSVFSPSDPQYALTNNSTTSATLDFTYEPGSDAYGDPWLIDESSIVFGIDPLIDSSNYSITPDKDSGKVTVDLINLDPDTQYTSNLSFTLKDSTDSSNTMDLSDEVIFDTKITPTISSVSTSNQTDTSVEVSWEVNDIDATITSITIQDTTSTLYEVSDPASNLSGSTVINGLTPETTYSDWKLVVNYDSTLSAEQAIDPFTTNPVPFIAPTITSTTASNQTDTSVEVSWDVVDTDETVTSITVQDTTSTLYEASDPTSNLSGSTLITGLTPETAYNDWKLVVGWNNEFGVAQTPAEGAINAFVTNPEENSAPIILLANSNVVSDISVEISWGIYDPDGALTSITVQDSSSTLYTVNDAPNNLNGSTTITGLTAETTYSDWKLVIEWNDEFGAPQTPVEKTIDPFTTNPVPFIAPTITSVSASDQTDSSIVINWDVVDTDETVTSITVQDTTSTLYEASDPASNLSGSTIITGLTQNTTYSDWKLVVEWDNELGITQTPVEGAIDPFKTDLTPFVAPTIEFTEVNNITDTSVQINWSISNPNAAISSITIQDSSSTLYTVSNPERNLNGSAIITGLTAETTYNDWKLVIEWSNEFEVAQTPVEQTIDSFTTTEEVIDEIDLELLLIILIASMFIILIIAIVLATFNKKI